jgi:hypothetical protein
LPRQVATLIHCFNQCPTVPINHHMIASYFHSNFFKTEAKDLPHPLIKHKRLSSLLIKSWAKTITKPQSGTHKIPTHTSPKRTSSTLHTGVIVITSSLWSNNSNPQTQSKWLRLCHRQSSNQPTPLRSCKDIWRSTPELSHQRQDNTAPTRTESHKGVRQGWRGRRSPNWPPVASHRTPLGPRHRSFDFTTTNKPRQT